mmetsp:Transcript_14674/g.33691  ORF Transcript_14674/g.33691 Transcript_14674/m.33691 type:complete len:223 (+) Transcript_14674:366-1034(+)
MYARCVPVMAVQQFLRCGVQARVRMHVEVRKGLDHDRRRLLPHGPGIPAAALHAASAQQAAVRGGQLHGRRAWVLFAPAARADSVCSLERRNHIPILPVAPRQESPISHSKCVALWRLFRSHPPIEHVPSEVSGLICHGTNRDVCAHRHFPVHEILVSSPAQWYHGAFHHSQRQQHPVYGPLDIPRHRPQRHLRLPLHPADDRAFLFLPRVGHGDAAWEQEQ